MSPRRSSAALVGSLAASGVVVFVAFVQAQARDAAATAVARKMVHWRRDIHVHLELSGHDAHTAMLTGAAEVLAAREKWGEARRHSGGWTKRPAPPPHPP